MDRQIIVLLSGGLDSSTLLAYVQKEMGMTPVPVFFDRKQQNHDAEFFAAKRVCETLGIRLHTASIRDWREGIPPEVRMEDIPRNAIMIFLAIPYAIAHSCSAIAIGSNVDDAGMKDSSKEFVSACNNLLQVVTPGVAVLAPFLENHMKKSDVAAWAYKHRGIDFINATVSCYKEAPCKACPACQARITALDNAKIPPDEIAF